LKKKITHEKENVTAVKETSLKQKFVRQRPLQERHHKKKQKERDNLPDYQGEGCGLAKQKRAKSGESAVGLQSPDEKSLGRRDKTTTPRKEAEKGIVKVEHERRVETK